MAGNDFAKFAVKAANLATGLQADMDKASLKTAQKVTAVAKTSIRIGAGGDSKLSGLGSKKTRAQAGAEVTARYEVAQQGGRGRATEYLVKGTKGLWLLDNPTRPHSLSKKKGKGRKGKKGYSAAQYEKTAAFYEQLFGAASQQHPGTRGKRTFWTAVERVTPLIPKWYDDALVQSMTRHLK